MENANVPQNPLIIQPIPSLEDLDGVQLYLKQIGSMSDKDLLRLYKETWGEGYQAITQNIEIIRSELIGFLLDLRDTFLAQILQQQYGSVSYPNSLPPTQSELMPESDQSISSTQNLQDMEFPVNPSTG
jgi:hypothetical protein